MFILLDKVLKFADYIIFLSVHLLLLQSATAHLRLRIFFSEHQLKTANSLKSKIFCLNVQTEPSEVF